MSFGKQLREAREARGWSRHKLAMKMNGLLSEAAIEALEYSSTREPHNGTKATLLRVLPELSGEKGVFRNSEVNFLTSTKLNDKMSHFLPKVSV